MRTGVKVGLFIILSFFVLIIGFFIFSFFDFSGKSTIYGKGKLLETADTKELNTEDLKINIRDISYFEQGSKSFQSNVKDSSESYFILDVEVENVSNLNQYVGDFYVKGNNFESDISLKIGSGIDNLFVFTEDIVNKYRLFQTGDYLKPGESSRGAVYVGLTEPIKDLTSDLDVVYSGSENLSIKGLIGDHDFEDTELLLLEPFRLVEEEELTLGELTDGRSVEMSDRELSIEGMEISFSDALIFEDIPESFKNSFLHLKPLSGNEKVLIINTKIKNITEENRHVGNFILSGENSNGSTAVRTFESEKAKNGYLSKKVMSEYKLLNYRGNDLYSTPLEGKEIIEGNIIFYTEEIFNDSEFDIKLEGVDGLSEKVLIFIR